MSLWGLESTYSNGRFRMFAEYADTNLPWSAESPFPGYINVVYAQGYTNGGRWVGASQGSSSRLTTLGWMDAANMQMAKLHFGRIGTSAGVYTPGVAQPNGNMWGFSAQQTLVWKGMSITPEVAYTRYDQGSNLAGGKRNSLRAGVSAVVGL